MLDKIRTVFNRTPDPAKTYTPEDLRRIGQTLSEEQFRLEEIRRLPIEEAARLYPGDQ
jgi:hypothetical protein